MFLCETAGLREWLERARPMNSAQIHIKYVKLPREEAVEPEVVAKVKREMFDGYVQRLVELPITPSSLKVFLSMSENVSKPT
jgi:hypothetical protein